MRREIALAGFVLTVDEWEDLDEVARGQLLAIGLRRDDGQAPSSQSTARAQVATPPSDRG